jgi:hypothetical protein
MVVVQIRFDRAFVPINKLLYMQAMQGCLQVLQR